MSPIRGLGLKQKTEALRHGAGHASAVRATDGEGSRKLARRRERRPRGERGQSLVEFALILPVFLVLVLGMLDFGSAYNIHNDMTQLAGEAVRFAAVDNCGDSCTSIESRVKQDADNGCLKGDGCGSLIGPDAPLSICFWYPLSVDNQPHPGNQVQAVLKVNYRWLPFSLLGLDHVGAVALRATATMRIEQASHLNYTPDVSC
jgi:hypothetical protein